MRICHLGPTTLPVLQTRGGAVQRRMLELAAQQAAAGHDAVILSADNQKREVVHRGVRIVSIRTRLPRPARDYEFLTKVRKFVRMTSPDIVHYHGLPDGARVVGYRRAAAVLSFDFYQFRGSENPLGWRHYRRSLDRFDRLLPVSVACGRMAADHWKVPFHEMRVLQNGVNVHQFKPDAKAGCDTRSRLQLGNDVIALYVGRLCTQKGTDLLLDAWERTSHRRNNTRLVLAGPVGQFGTDGPNEFGERIQSLNVTYLGAVDESELAGVYNACDVFVMPTRHAEMFGMAALEAQACGKPVIASRWGGLTEAVSEKGGLFFTPNDTEELADLLVTLFEDPARRAAMSQPARRHAERFDWATIADDAMKIYDESAR